MRWLCIAICAAVPAVVPAASPGGLDPRVDLVEIPGGRLQQGDPEGEPDEAPREVPVGDFRIMRHEVTNAMFARFVAASGHVTDPEQRGWGWVWTGTWRSVEGADWRRPEGPGSAIARRADHPVVQVSKQDAEAFCAFHGLRLPSDPEWEYAARGQDRRRYPWGDEAPEASDGSRRANFGTVACCAADDADGHETTAPVGSFPAGASPFGLMDMAGNVWEWTRDPHPGEPGEFAIRGGGWGNNPYCLRVAYRHGNPPRIGLDMVGFRCAADAAE